MCGFFSGLKCDRICGSVRESRRWPQESIGQRMRGIVRHIALVIVKIPWDFENGIRLLLNHLLYEHQASDLFKKEGRMPGDGV